MPGPPYRAPIATPSAATTTVAVPFACITRDIGQSRGLPARSRCRSSRATAAVGVSTRTSSPTRLASGVTTRSENGAGPSGSPTSWYVRSTVARVRSTSARGAVPEARDSTKTAKEAANAPALARRKPSVMSDLHLDEPAQPGTLPHGVHSGLQHLGQVAADLALDPDRHHQPLQVLAAGTFGHLVQRRFHLDAEQGLRQRPAELAGDRLTALAYQDVERLRQREPGPQRADDQLQRVRKLFGEAAGSASAAHPEVQPGEQPTPRCAEQHRGPPRQQQYAERDHRQGDTDPQQQPFVGS